MQTMFTLNIMLNKHAEQKEMDEKWLDRSYYWSGLLSVIIQNV